MTNLLICILFIFLSLHFSNSNFTISSKNVTQPDFSAISWKTVTTSNFQAIIVYKSLSKYKFEVDLTNVQLKNYLTNIKLLNSCYHFKNASFFMISSLNVTLVKKWRYGLKLDVPLKIIVITHWLRLCFFTIFLGKTYLRWQIKLYNTFLYLYKILNHGCCWKINQSKSKQKQSLHEWRSCWNKKKSCKILT